MVDDNDDAGVVDLKAFVEQGSPEYSKPPTGLQRNLQVIGRAGPARMANLLREKSVDPSKINFSNFGDLVPPTAPYSSSNYTTSRSLDVSTATLAEVLDVVATLIADLKSKRILG